MTTKEFLSRAINIDIEIRARNDTLEQLRSVAEKTTATLTAMPSAPGSDHSKEEIYIRMAELAEEQMESIKHLYQVKREIAQAIDTVEDTTQRTVLILRYQNYRNWEDISERMSYSLRTVFDIHGAALQHVKIPH